MSTIDPRTKLEIEMTVALLAPLLHSDCSIGDAIVDRALLRIEVFVVKLIDRAIERERIRNPPPKDRPAALPVSSLPPRR